MFEKYTWFTGSNAFAERHTSSFTSFTGCCFKRSAAALSWVNALPCRVSCTLLILGARMAVGCKDSFVCPKTRKSERDDAKAGAYPTLPDSDKKRWDKNRLTWFLTKVK